MINLPKLSKLSIPIIKQRFEEFAQLSVDRNARYGNSVVFLSDIEVIKLCLTKLTRTISLFEQVSDNSGNTYKIDDKIFDEIKDTINYLMFVILRRTKRVFIDFATASFEEVYKMSKDRQFITFDEYMQTVDMFIKGIETVENSLELDLQAAWDPDLIQVDSYSDWVAYICRQLFDLAVGNISAASTCMFQQCIYLIGLWFMVSDMDKTC